MHPQVEKIADVREGVSAADRARSSTMRRPRSGASMPLPGSTGCRAQTVLGPGPTRRGVTTFSSPAATGAGRRAARTRRRRGQAHDLASMRLAVRSLSMKRRTIRRVRLLVVAGLDRRYACPNEHRFALDARQGDRTPNGKMFLRDIVVSPATSPAGGNRRAPPCPVCPNRTS